MRTSSAQTTPKIEWFAFMYNLDVQFKKCATVCFKVYNVYVSDLFAKSGCTILNMIWSVQFGLYNSKTITTKLYKFTLYKPKLYLKPPGGALQ